MPTAGPSRSRCRWGFTLVEVLVSISIVAILLALSLSALFGTKSAASATLSLANIRGAGQSFASYAAAHQDHHPWAAPFAPLFITPPDEDGAARIGSDSPWILSTAWPALFHEVAPWREHYKTWLNPPRGAGSAQPWAGEADAVTWPSYHYVRSLLARPEVWSGEAAPADPSHSAGTRAAEVAFPSSKVILFDADLAYLRRQPKSTDPRAVATCDGAASMKLDSSARAPVANRINSGGLAAHIYHDTRDGVRGVDF